MTLPDYMDARLRAAVAAEAEAHRLVLELVGLAHAEGGTLREIGAAIGRSHTQVGRMVDAARAEASS